MDDPEQSRAEKTERRGAWACIFLGPIVLAVVPRVLGWPENPRMPWWFPAWPAVIGILSLVVFIPLRYRQRPAADQPDNSRDPRRSSH